MDSTDYAGADRAAILVMNDEEDMRELLKYNMEKEGHRVLCARSGRDAAIERYSHPRYTRSKHGHSAGDQRCCGSA